MFSQQRLDGRSLSDRQVNPLLEVDFLELTGRRCIFLLGGKWSYGSIFFLRMRSRLNVGLFPYCGLFSDPGWGICRKIKKSRKEIVTILPLMSWSFWTISSSCILDDFVSQLLHYLLIFFHLSMQGSVGLLKLSYHNRISLDLLLRIHLSLPLLALLQLQSDLLRFFFDLALHQSRKLVRNFLQEVVDKFHSNFILRLFYLIELIVSFLLIFV